MIKKLAFLSLLIFFFSIDLSFSQSTFGNSSYTLPSKYTYEVPVEDPNVKIYKTEDSYSQILFQKFGYHEELYSFEKMTQVIKSTIYKELRMGEMKQEDFAKIISWSRLMKAEEKQKQAPYYKFVQMDASVENKCVIVGLFVGNKSKSYETFMVSFISNSGADYPILFESFVEVVNSFKF